MPEVVGGEKETEFWKLLRESDGNEGTVMHRSFISLFSMGPGIAEI